MVHVVLALRLRSVLVMLEQKLPVIVRRCELDTRRRLHPLQHGHRPRVDLLRAVRLHMIDFQLFGFRSTLAAMSTLLLLVPAVVQFLDDLHGYVAFLLL